MIFSPANAGGLTLEEFLATQEGRKLAGPTGGIQGAKGTLFGVTYEPGSWQDKLIEAFAGTHDYVGGTMSGLYDEEGNARRAMSSTESKSYGAWSGIAIPMAAPFAAAQALPPSVWQAISMILRNGK